MVKVGTEAPARWREPRNQLAPPPSTGAPLLASTGKLGTLRMSSPSAQVRTLSESLSSLDRIVCSGQIGPPDRSGMTSTLPQGGAFAERHPFHRTTEPERSFATGQPPRKPVVRTRSHCDPALRASRRGPHCCPCQLLVLIEPELRCWSIQHPLRTRPRLCPQSHSPLGPALPAIDDKTQASD